MLYILTHILILFVVDPQVKAEDDRAGDLGKHPSGEVCRQEKRGRRVRHAWEWDSMRSLKVDRRE